MSQKSKPAKNKPAARSAVATAASQSANAPLDRGTVPSRRCTIMEYIIMNVIFDGFILAQAALVMSFMRETRGLYFFFGLLMVAFFVVSVFDYVYDRYFRDDFDDEETLSPAPASATTASDAS